MWLKLKLTKVKNIYVLKCSITSQHYSIHLEYHPMWVFCPSAGVSVYDMVLTDAEWLRVVGCGLKCKLVQLLSQGMGNHFQRACHQMMVSIFQRMASKRMATMCDNAVKEAEELYASGQCAAALVPLQHAIDMGSISAYALMAWWHINIRKGIVLDRYRGFKLAEKGASLGCYHSQGVLAYCYLGSNGCGYGCNQNIELSFKLALESAGKNSKYGQITLGHLHHLGLGELGGLGLDCAQGVVFFQLAAAQRLPDALFMLGHKHNHGINCAIDYSEAMRLYKLSAAQGHPMALFCIAKCYEKGWGVAADIIKAIHWYERAKEAGHIVAKHVLLKILTGTNAPKSGSPCR
jgi:TPR repeat protein